MTEPFVHLSVHSEYSVADGIVKVGDLVERTAAAGMPAVALTDRCNLFALVRFYDACLARGVKPIVGVELSHFTADGAAEAHRVIALAADATGYAGIIELVSRAYAESPRRGMVRTEWLESNASGIIVLSGGRHGDVGRALLKGDTGAARRCADRWAEHFGDRYYLELTRTGRDGEEALVGLSVELAVAMNLPVVATNDVCFLDADDFEAHETRVCIHDGRTLNDPRRERRYSEQQYLRSPDEMARVFADLPEALANAHEIARRATLTIDLDTYHLPSYPIPAGTTLEAYFETEAQRGLAARQAALAARGVTPPAPVEVYRERLAYELRIINQMGYAGYYLIVMEFVRWARENGIPVGPGRGSGPGSLAAFALGITDLDPLEYDLLFERFLNPERVSMPDFDIDFCMIGRDRVIAHVAERYGQDAVGQIVTFGTMAAKAVVRDVARVQGKPYGLADKLSKLIPFEVGMTLGRAVEGSAELRDFIAENDEVGEIMEMAYKLEGIVRNVGRHAGGVVIAPSKLTDFVPLYAEEAGASPVSQFDKDDVERAGLVKFDFLGLKTLTIVAWAVEAIDANGAAEPVDISAIPLDDPAAYALLQRADTTAVFQLESRGMKDLMRRLAPGSVEDIIALVALFRPGPLQSGMVDDFIDRKHGKAPVYPHPDLEGVLGNTYGVILYQEQVMQIAQVLAGFTLGQADLLRRAMGKKKPAEMARMREQFNAGAIERGVDAALADQIFDLMDKFAGYGFNKCHSAAYALVTYQTAWLKANYPAEFMAAVLSADMQSTDKVVTLIDDVRSMSLTLSPPDVNASAFRFTAGNGAILYGLGGIRGVGAGPVAAMVASREANGPFTSLPDFCRRIDTRRANRRVVEALIRAGAMDCLGDPKAPDRTRAELMTALADAMQGAEQAARDEAIGMTDLFGGVATGDAAKALGKRRVRPWSRRERLEAEKETLGLYLTGHPIDDYLEELRRFSPCINEVRPDKRKQIVSGLVVSCRAMRSRRGDNLAFVVLDDRSGRIEASIFAEVYASAREKLTKDAVLILEGEVQPDDEISGLKKIRVDAVYDMADARARFADGLEIDLEPTRAAAGAHLKGLLEPHRHPGCRVSINYRSARATARLALGASWQVVPCDELLERLRSEFGEHHVRLRYPAR